MIESVPEVNNDLPEITVSDEEDALILELRSEVKFLREMLSLAIKNSGKLNTRISPSSASSPVDTVITDFDEAKHFLEGHYYREAEKVKLEKERTKGNEADPKS